MQDKWHVMKKFSITESHFDRIILIIKKRHKKEDWVVIRKFKSGEENLYLRLECVAWLEEVHFNTSGFWLDREINFFKKQILRLENELKLQHKVEKFNPSTTVELRKRFKKSKNVIFKAIQKMIERCNKDFKIYKADRIVILPEGVKWLKEKYFRKDYLIELEDYKIELQKRKRELHI